jgi:predicted glycoside hydrolase/deacetylase ChbG (UPF0249 family)
MAAPPVPFLLCADDYALDAEVDAGILALLGARRLSGASALVDSPRWPEAAAALRVSGSTAFVGLHLDFTQPFGTRRHWSLPLLVTQAYWRQLPADLVAERIAAQLERFRAYYGRLPDYIDGHQHVHQLPQIREALLAEIDRHWPPGVRPWVRLSLPTRWRGYKAALIGALGAHELRAGLLAAGLRFNPDFAGVYSLSPRAHYGGLMRGWLADLAPGGVVMCHPARRDGAADAPLAEARRREFDYLMSPAFPADCAETDRELVRPT